VSVVGFALAGGASRRMGRDKALLPLGETDLLGHALARLSRVTDDVRILCGAEPRYADRGVPLVTDTAAGLGPLAGTLAALTAASGHAALLLAVDLPNVPVDLLARLVALLPGFDAVVPRSPRGSEPLCAVYGPGCLEPVRACIAESRLAMRSFWRDIRLCELGPDGLATFGDPEHIFRNVNSPEDY
jgi:molybdopterin-guanine dinucleotide biosynthesis protein A